MKNGKTLSELAQEIERQNLTKRDFVVDTRAIEVKANTENTAVSLALGNDDFGINQVGHRQIGTHTNIPAIYYDRMLTKNPALLAENVNTWMRQEPSSRMVRSLDGKVRAFLSDKYRPLENVDLAEAALPIFADLKLQVVSCEVTDYRLYIKAVDPRIVSKVPTRRMVNGSLVTYDDVCPTLCLSNSEVGMGALSLDVGMFTHACKNMMLFRESSLKKYHVGGKHELFGENLRELMSDKTRRVTDAALWMQVQDVVKGAFDTVRFEKNVDQVRALTEQRISGDPIKVVELTSAWLNLVEAEKKSVLRHLIEGGDLTRYGVLNAITRTAEDAASYDRATELERAGGQIVELAANDWRQIAEAA
jgi:hypothetical protein